MDDLAVQVLGHVAVDDAVGNALGNGRLPHPRLSNQNGVVFRATAEDLKHATDFVVAADDGVEFAVKHELIEVTRVFG